MKKNSRVDTLTGFETPQKVKKYTIVIRFPVRLLSLKFYRHRSSPHNPQNATKMRQLLFDVKNKSET